MEDKEIKISCSARKVWEYHIRDWIDFPLVAVCTSATVDYGQYQMAGDSSGWGQGAPSILTLNLGFIETAQLSRQKYANEVAAAKGGPNSRAEEGTKLGALSRLSDEEIKALKNQGQGSGGEAPPPSG